MIKELLLIGLLATLSGLAITGTAVVWRRWGRPGRVTAMVCMLASYDAFSFWIVELAQEGGWPNGMFTVLAGMVLVPATTLGVTIAAVYATFLGKVAGETPTPQALRRRRTGALVTYGLAVLGAVGVWAWRAAEDADRYHPPYPPTSAGVVDRTASDVEAGQAAYRDYAGQTVRVLRPPVVACRQARFGRSRHVSWFEPLGVERLEGPILKVLEVRHIGVFGEEDDPGPGFDYADIVLSVASGERLHLFAESSTRHGEATLVSSDPMGDAVLQHITLKPVGSTRSRWPATDPLESVWGADALGTLPQPPPAPPLSTLADVDQAAAARLIEQLESSPGEGTLAALGSAERLRCRELAMATVSALRRVRPLPPRDGNSYEECAATILGAIGDPVALDVLLELASDASVANRRSAVRALGRVGSCRALPTLERATRQADPAQAAEALAAMCEVIGAPGAREPGTLATARAAVIDDPASSKGHLLYGARSCVAACPTGAGACDVRLLRETVSELGTFIQLAPEGPQAVVALVLLDGIERLHGI